VGDRPPDTDARLLRATDHSPPAFGEFYDRHEDTVLSYFLRRSDSAALAADLTAETFARALLWRRDYDPNRVGAPSWVLGIAHDVFDESYRLGRVTDRIRRRVDVPSLPLDDASLTDIERLRDVDGKAS
jgi:RNA polymerase sigma-70 factor (ECF subfamily)